MEILRVRKLADRSAPVARFDPTTGEPLANPEPYALAGLRIENDGGPPTETTVGITFIDRGIAEGWLSVQGETVVHRPGGPASNPHSLTHTFRHFQRIVLHTVDGDVTYRVVHQADKYALEGYEQPTDAQYAAGQTRVDWFVTLELEA
ncbi:MAG: hypothetical protein AB7I38_14360 [Dehalococcoidia bacterium]